MMRRRRFLQTSVALAGGAIGAGCADGDDNTGLLFDAALFPQSVASGDPTPTSLVFWTRVDGVVNAGGIGADADVPVSLQLAKDPDFVEVIPLGDREELRLVAELASDHCVRVRVEGLEPGTRYYYRFLHDRNGVRYRSRTGRAKTAPPPDADVPVRFGVMSCQDYAGRYYHALCRATELDLDFIVHLGDYVYERADAPAQDDGSARRVRFADPESALVVDAAPGVEPPAESDRTGALAARSLDNYRDLYKTYRSDPDLQRLHERFAMIAIWDDHEFANDAHGQTATHRDGRENETDPERRANADQAWSEYMPVDYSAEPAVAFDRSAAFPRNLVIYRDFRFGRHLHLVLTDLRRFRSDHVIDESAFPGAVAVDQARLEALFGEVPAIARAYVDLDGYRGGELGAALRDASAAGIDLGVEGDVFAGQHDAGFLNRLIDIYNAQAGMAGLAELEPIDVETEALERGVAYVHAGKTEQFAAFGSRYVVVADAFEIIARDRFLDSDGVSEQAMGAEQEAWFVEALASSDRTWKLWGNEYMLQRLALDLTSLPVSDQTLRQHFLLSADAWDGMPNRRAQLLEQLADVDNLVVLTGDIHSFFVGHLGLPEAPGVVEIVAGAVSSQTFREVLESGGLGIGELGGVADLAAPIIASSNPHLAYQNIRANGFATIELDGQELLATLHQLDFEKVKQSTLPGSLADHFDSTVFRLRAGSSAIQQRIDGEFRTWDPANGQWL